MSVFTKLTFDVEVLLSHATKTNKQHSSVKNRCIGIPCIEAPKDSRYGQAALTAEALGYSCLDVEWAATRQFKIVNKTTISAAPAL